MLLNNHIVRKVLEDNLGFTIEVMEAIKGSRIIAEDVEQYNDIAHTMSNKNNKTYYVTKTVIDRLALLDTKKCMQVEGWKIFKSLPDFKKTYILPEMAKDYSKYGGSGYVRIAKFGDLIFFVHVSSKFLSPEQRTRTIDSSMYIVVLYIDLREGKICEHFYSADGKSLAPFLYSLMCFVELCDNEVVIIPEGRKYGTKKSDKIINTLPTPITIINNNWNITTIKGDGFPVSGHAAIYWTGVGRVIPKLLYVEPYMKSGYTRVAGKLMEASK